MRQEGLRGLRKDRRVVTSSRHQYPVAPNLLNREFHSKSRNQKWVADITYIPTEEGVAVPGWGVGLVLTQGFWLGDVEPH